MIDQEYNHVATEAQDSAAAPLAPAGAGAGVGAGAGAEADTVDDLAAGLRDILLGPPKYGFNDSRQGVFANLGEECALILDLPAPDSTPPGNRRRKWRRC